MTFDTLKKTLRALDLAVAMGRKKQSPRTGFLHLFPSDETASDTIPIYENFLFAFALIRQKSAEAVLEGKELISRLLAFQTAEGNFPLYIHDYPRCWDHSLSLKIAPICLYLLRGFGPILGASFKAQVETALHKLLQFATAHQLKEGWPPVWEARLEACLGHPIRPPDPLLGHEWFEWIVSLQLLGNQEPLPIPFHTEAHVFLGENESQERGEPLPLPFEYLLAEQQGIGSRLLRPHIHQLQSALLFPLTTSQGSSSPWTLIPRQTGGIRLLWQGGTIHSLLAPSGRWEGDHLLFSLPEAAPVSRDDLYEVALFCNLSPETHLFIGGAKGTLFCLGDTVSIQTPQLQVDLRFSILEGKGEFCGHIARANRPGQIACRGDNLYETYDWKIGLRTLRRDEPCTVKVDFILRTSHSIGPVFFICPSLCADEKYRTCGMV